MASYKRFGKGFFGKLLTIRLLLSALGVLVALLLVLLAVNNNWLNSGPTAFPSFASRALAWLGIGAAPVAEAVSSEGAAADSVPGSKPGGTGEAEEDTNNSHSPSENPDPSVNDGEGQNGGAAIGTGSTEGSQAGGAGSEPGSGMQGEPGQIPAAADAPEVQAVNWPPSPLFLTKVKNEVGGWISSFRDGGRLNWAVLQQGEIVPEFAAEETIAFGEPYEYSSIEGVLTFRGNNQRSSAAFGTRNVAERRLELVWSQPTGSIRAMNSYWPGTGWTGQPLLVRWPEASRNAMNLFPEANRSNLVEVIYPAMDGNIYFLDLENGKATRPKIEYGYTFKGTGAVDPRGYPLLFIGQSLNENASGKRPFQFMIFDLTNQQQLWAMPGRDADALRNWGAFDASALIHAPSDTLFQAGENGLMYRVKLNSRFDAAAKNVSLNPEVTKFRYTSSYHSALGIENSPSIYKNLMFFADNGGTLQAVDINTFEPKWMANLGDDTDASTVISEEAEGVFLYTANQLDNRPLAVGATGAYSNLRKFNATTGELVWQRDIPVLYQSFLNGGALATPLVGKNDISNMVIFNISLTGESQQGTLIALDKSSGITIWERTLSSYSWSSPVDVLSDDGKTWVIVCDSAGYMHLVDPLTGLTVNRISLEANIESSPAVFNDMIVVGSYAKKIFGIKIR